MKSFKTILKLSLVAITLGLTLTGCNEPQTKAEAIHQNQRDNDVKVYCDKEVGVEYLKFSNFNGMGGLTLRVNPDGTVKTCSKI